MLQCSNKQKQNERLPPSDDFAIYLSTSQTFFFFACIFMSICPNTSFYVFFPSVFSFSASCPSVQHSLCWSNLKLCLRVCLVCFLFLTVFLCLGWSIIQLSTDTATCLSLGLHVFLPWSLCL